MLFRVLALPAFFVFAAGAAHVGGAPDSLSSGQSLSGNQTIVSRDGHFVLGFFSPGKSRHHYIGIWFGKIPKQTVVWVANREAPISDPSAAELRVVSQTGSLVLLTHSTVSPVWSSNPSGAAAGNSSSVAADRPLVAELLETGNLVLRRLSDPSAVLWQSFDHPTDTWLPGGWVGLNKETGEYQSLRSWRNADDPAPGPFSYRIDEGGSSRFNLWWKGSVSYWSTGVWTGQFSKMPEVKSSKNFNFTYVDDRRRRGYTYSVQASFVYTRGTLDNTGTMNLFVWLRGADDWQQVWSQPILHCDVYAVCGALSVCDERNAVLCECLRGFEPAAEEDWNSGDWSGGCARRSRLSCDNGGGNEVEFLATPGLLLPPVGSRALAVKGAGDCERACRGDCNCTAYSYDSRCLIWHGELLLVRKFYGGDGTASTLFVRMPSASSMNEKERRRPKLILYIIAGVLVFLLAVSIVILTLLRRRRRHGVSRMAEGSLISFRYASLQQITKNFSEKLGGGGFGCVYKGTLRDSTMVAVKKLEGHGGQGEKQFRTEVSALGTVHHVNLVRLHGFCAEGRKRLLVYEYLPLGSLEAHLFKGGGGVALAWAERYRIIVGVARGLAYLHEKCRESIIHCDIKPENILLDAEFQPKIADFGLAKLLSRDFSRVLTTMRGTVGYLAPEWLSGLPITTKADVYSYGLLVLEIVAGRRNVEKDDARSISYYPLRAALQLRAGEVLELLDERLGGAADVLQLTRACQAACWCIQGSEDHRPAMTQVVGILEGVVEVNPPPVPRYLHHIAGDEHSD